MQKKLAKASAGAFATKLRLRTSKGSWHPLQPHSKPLTQMVVKKQKHLQVRGADGIRLCPAAQPLTRSRWERGVPDANVAHGSSIDNSEKPHSGTPGPIYFLGQPSVYYERKGRYGNKQIPWYKYKSQFVPTEPKHRKAVHPNLGVFLRSDPLRSPDVDASKMRALNYSMKLKSLTSLALLKRIQSDVVGHIFVVDRVPYLTTQYLRCQGEYVKVVSKPSLCAVRQLMKMFFFSRKSTFRLTPILKDYLQSMQ